MILATPPTVQMRLVRDDPDDQDDPSADLNQVRMERDVARNEAATLRRRAAQLDEHLSQLDGELRLAGRLQRDFLPKSLPRVGPARFAAMLRPASHVTGDFYDVVRLDEDHVGFYVADAVGHGVPAALLTMFIKHSLVTKHIGPDGTYRLLSPGESLALLNVSLLDQGLSAATFATAAYGIVNVRTRQVTIARAGHPNPLLLSGTDGSATPIQCDGGLLGILPDETFTAATFTLGPGDRLLLYTDGVEVAFDRSANDSLNRWAELLAENGRADIDDFVKAISDASEAFNGDAPPRDDLTLLALQLD